MVYPRRTEEVVQRSVRFYASDWRLVLSFAKLRGVREPVGGSALAKLLVDESKRALARAEKKGGSPRAEQAKQ